MSHLNRWISIFLFFAMVSLSCLGPFLSGQKPAVPTMPAIPTNNPIHETIPEVTPTYTPTPISPSIPTPDIIPVSELPIVNIPLSDPLAEKDVQISGLAWYRDTLVILPQYPSWFPNQSSPANLFALSKSEILAFLDNPGSGALIPKYIPLKDRGINSLVANFEGFEAIAFMDERIFLTIEAQNDSGWVSYLVSGSIEPDLAGIRLEPDTLTQIPQPVSIFNKSDEALVVAGDDIISLYEANGKTVNPNPTAHLFDGQTLVGKEIPMQSVEYRITDATPIDENGQFWALNIFWPGEIFLLSLDDPIANQYGEGPTHAKTSIVERLIKLEYSPQGVSVVNQPPLLLELTDKDDTRNWEGLALLDEIGFLIATDEFPETILAFVPNP